MPNRLSVLLTVYNESEYVEYAIRACLPHIDDLVIVEGSYLETINLGATNRSDDGTLEIIEQFRNEKNVSILFANEQSDKDQRNVGLQKIKELNPNGWLLIVDADEVYTKDNFAMVRNIAKTMEKDNKKACYFRSLTFVNDFKHYVDQDFPRLFKITPECTFVNDNHMTWKDSDWSIKHVIKIPYLRFHHYAFTKDIKRFNLKKQWWETRFGKAFDYGWRVNDEGKIEDANHFVQEYKGNHPEIMKEHPKYKEVYNV
jgi:glycosyltransferase involved in cell wall biosynthesis